jgi:hypothetical protein
VAIAFCLGGCSTRPAPNPDFAVAVTVQGDPATPLAAASVIVHGVALGATDAAGKAVVRLRGAEGDTIPLWVRCPADYTSPATPLNVTLRRLGEASPTPSYTVTCPPELRDVVVAVRTNVPDLPVLYLRNEVARTDASGAAHVALRLRPGERFELLLSTAGDGKETLLPQNPTAVFVAKDEDQVLAFDQHFEVPKAHAVHRAPIPAGPRPF